MYGAASLHAAVAAADPGAFDAFADAGAPVVDRTALRRAPGVRLPSGETRPA